MAKQFELTDKGIARRRALGFAGSILTLSVVPKWAHAAAAQVLAVRTWPADEYTRVTIELSAPLNAEHFMLDNPNRLVVDLQGISLNQALNSLVSQIKPNDPYIRSIRVAQNRADVVRLVMDLKQQIAPQVFTLKPIGDYQYRLVLDLYPKVAHDPLMALLDSPGDDPLASVIDQLGSSRPTTNAPTVQGQLAPKAPVAPPSNSGRNRGSRPVLIAIDPGHGGEDPGAIGPRGTREKDVVLAISKQLRDQINAQPNMRAYMTRDADFFVPLQVRVQKARRVKADIFVSIHADAFSNPSARGTTVFTLSTKGASSAAAKWLANKENNADMIGGVDFGAHDRSTASVLLDMSTSQQIQDSLKIGHRVLSSLGKINGVHSRRVEQAGFAVLRSPDIPSILIETAFISNPQEEQFLRSSSNQRALAKGILGGLQAYLATNPPLARLG
ncbi:N-acetylmuramoyl-L-alanine amidase AmiC [Oligella sp. MSHR50489EDL]|uniref:N-acetylmuramoyl-L-alanine amidase n=1 Tax=Oligella sp. MSHR50489EDL TaxID=3139409 RepID=UPI003D81A5C2